MKKPESHKKYAVAVLCAIDFELGAFRHMLDKEHPPLSQVYGDDNAYVLGELGGHNIVVTLLPGTQGKAAAQKVSTDLSRTFPAIRWRLLVGIGGGVVGSDEDTRLKRDLRLGDVVVAWPKDQHCGVIQYDYGREKNDGYEIKGFLAPSSARLRSSIGILKSSLGLRRTIQKHVASMISNFPEDEPELRAEYARPEEKTDLLFPEDVPIGSPASIAIPRAPRRPPGIPKIHYGLIATGDSVMKSCARRDALCTMLKPYGDVLCFEMEAAGLATETSCTVIRGIADYADQHKNDKWQGYAAATAAAYAKELLLNVQPGAVDEGAGAIGVDAGHSEHLGRGAEVGRWNIRQFQGRGIQNIGGTITMRDFNID